MIWNLFHNFLKRCVFGMFTDLLLRKPDFRSKLLRKSHTWSTCNKMVIKYVAVNSPHLLQNRKSLRAFFERQLLPFASCFKVVRLSLRFSDAMFCQEWMRDEKRGFNFIETGLLQTEDTCVNFRGTSSGPVLQDHYAGRMREKADEMATGDSRGDDFSQLSVVDSGAKVKAK